MQAQNIFADKRKMLLSYSLMLLHMLQIAETVGAIMGLDDAIMKALIEIESAKLPEPLGENESERHHRQEVLKEVQLLLHKLDQAPLPALAAFRLSPEGAALPLPRQSLAIH
jgi:hypothetical protein